MLLETPSPLGHIQFPLWQLPPWGHVLPHPPQLLESDCSLTQAPPQPVWPLGQQTPPEAVSPLGHAQLPFWQLPPCGHTLPQPPQFIESVSGTTHWLPQVSPQRQAPSWHTWPAPSCCAHHSSDCGSSSTIPSQLSSLPLQICGEYWHWQMFPDCPISAPHVQPGTQSLTLVHGVVQTLPVQPASPPAGSPTERQIPLGQSEFFVHGCPVPFAGRDCPSSSPASWLPFWPPLLAFELEQLATATTTTSTAASPASIRFMRPPPSGPHHCEQHTSPEVQSLFVVQHA
jgi:hypothetical protein